MYRTVLQDYRHHIKSAFKNLTWTDWYITFYLGILSPVIFDFIESNSAEYYASFIPLQIGLILTRMYNGIIPKSLFLCPLSKEQRKQYAICGMHIRLTIPIILFLFFNIIIILCGVHLPLSMLAARFIILTIGCVAYNVYHQPPHTSEGSAKNFSQQGVIQSLTLITLLILCMFEYNETLWELILTGCLAAAQIIYCAVAIKKHYHEAINHIMYYETFPKKIQKGR